MDITRQESDHRGPPIVHAVTACDECRPPRGIEASRAGHRTTSNLNPQTAHQGSANSKPPPQKSRKPITIRF